MKILASASTVKTSHVFYSDYIVSCKFKQKDTSPFLKQENSKS